MGSYNQIMPTNLPPDYFQADRRFRESQTLTEKIACLEEMYSLVPKHKGTDHLRADLRRQLSRLKQEAQTHKHPSGHAAIYHIEREGAGQAVLLGPTNVGKSALLAALSHATPEISAAPFTTWKPVPGMMAYQNVQIQLVDTPSTDREFVEGALFDLARRADVLLMVVDLGADPFVQYEQTLALLDEHRIVPRLEGIKVEDTGRVEVPTLVLANKCDSQEQEEDFSVFCELFSGHCPALPVSALSRRNLDTLGRWIYEHLGIIRVYPRPPGRQPDLERPFVLKTGSTVEDLAAKVHRDFFEKLKTARVWGSSAFPGQSVERNYLLCEGDIVELRI